MVLEVVPPIEGEQLTVCPVCTELVQPSPTPKNVGGGEVTLMLWLWLAQALPLQADSWIR